jgi:hypothetical protein
MASPPLTVLSAADKKDLDKVTIFLMGYTLTLSARLCSVDIIRFFAFYLVNGSSLPSDPMN